MISHSEKENLKLLANKIKRLRKEKGIMQYDFDVNVRTIQRLENSKDNFNPTYLTLLKISDTLGISVSELLDFSDEKKKTN
jgi:transcriptional regulator with XRE-family HTH domain